LHSGILKFLNYMNPPESVLLRCARWLTFASAVSIIFGIAPSQILLALAFAALLASGAQLRLPRIRLPLALFLLGTLIALAFSGDVAGGLPQVRKFFVFLELLVVFSLLRKLQMVRWLFLCWAGAGAIAAIAGYVQFARKVQEAHLVGRSFYDYYVGERITGFTSHWNTYSAEEMFALIMLASFLLFAPGTRRRLWLWLSCAALMAVAILLAETRAIWIAVAVAGLYLVWFWRRGLVLLAPVAVLAIFLASPAAVRERFTSIYRPKGVDSNQFRIVTWRTGIHMIEAHPWLGLGPEGPNLHFDEWIPADIPRPLPSGWYHHLHNIYLQYAAERGIPTMLVMMWILIQMLVDFARGLLALPPGRSDRRFLLHGAIAVILATMVEGVFEYNLGISPVLTMFLVTVGCGYVALDVSSETTDLAPAPVSSVKPGETR
jgi:putative inorganic carbon (HCO3(-)) transporter